MSDPRSEISVGSRDTVSESASDVFQYGRRRHRARRLTHGQLQQAQEDWRVGWELAGRIGFWRYRDCKFGTARKQQAPNTMQNHDAGRKERAGRINYMSLLEQLAGLEFSGFQ